MIDPHRDEIAKLESLYAMNPEGRVFTHLAEACRKAGQLDRARQILEQGLQKHPDYASAHVVLGRVLADSGEDGPAVAEFRRVLELDRHNLVALRSLGELATRAGRTEEALHYWSELAVLDPTDSQIQDVLRELREKRTAEPATEPAPADADEDSADADDTAAAEPLVIESHEATTDPTDPEVTPLAGLETTRAAPEPESAWPAPTESGLPEWQRSDREADQPDEPDELELPGAAAPIDEEAWREIAAAGGGALMAEALSGAESADDTEPDAASYGPEPSRASRESAEAASADEVEEAGDDSVAEDDEESAGPAADGEPPVEEDHARFAPPDLLARRSDGPDDSGESEGPPAEAEAEETEAPEAPDTSRVEGRWQMPEPVPGDVQAERSRPTDDAGEWIPAERWDWMAASADVSRDDPAGEDEEGGGDAEVEEPVEAEGEDTRAGYDAETSFAGLTDEPEAPWSGDDETSFAGLTEDDEPSRTAADASSQPDRTGEAEEEFEVELELASEETSLAGIVEGEPVDSFEEGAAAVLDEFARAGGQAAAGSEEAVAGDEEPVAGDEAADDAGAASVTWVSDAEDEGDQVITETLAEIYASQGLHDRAAEVYRRLIDRHPEDDRLSARLAELESSAGWSEDAAVEAVAPDEDREAFLERVESAWTGGEGAAGLEESPYAWPQTGAAEREDGPRVGDYFDSLLAWRPSEAVPSAAMEPPEQPGLSEDWYSEADREADASESGEQDREGEEDLEMFRSWLKSLKK